MSYINNNDSNFTSRLPNRGYYSPKSYANARSSLRSHWITFLSVNSFLFLLNLLSGYEYPWHIFPLFSWGIGIGIHTAVVLIRSKYSNRSDREFYIHFAVYLIVNAFILMINLLSVSGVWFIWPVLTWGIGLGCHAVAYNAKRRKLMGLHVSKYYSLWYPGIVCIFLAFVDLITGGDFGWFLWPTIPIMLIAYISIDHSVNKQHYREMRRESLPLVGSANNSNNSQQYSQSNVKIKYCPRCGEEIEPNFLFCEYCGQKLH
ncbi:2TM domain-containing protein [Candidatus Harpocratesius sp.]